SVCLTRLTHPRRRRGGRRCTKRGVGTAKMPRSDATAAGVSLDARRGETLAAMRSLRRTLLWAAAAGLLLSCSVNQSGLTEDGGGHADGGTGARGNRRHRGKR